MTTCPREPNPGDKITASWMRELVRYVRSLTPVKGRNYRVSRGPDGYSLDFDIPRPKPSTVKHGGLFEIAKVEIEESATVSEDENDDTITGTVSFSNRYFRLGGKTYEATAEECEVSSGQFVALKVGVSESDLLTDYLVAYDDLEALQEAEADMDYYLVPLYKFDDGLAVECDFRIGPFMSAGEVS